MWVFDGERWIDEGGSEQSNKNEQKPPRYEEFMPELQVIEVEVVVPVPRTNYVPPFPLA